MTFAPIPVPADIDAALSAGAALSISISGGKDSQAMLNALVALRRERGWSGPVFAIHADLGRVEWKQTQAYVEKIAADAGVELVIVRREQGDLLARWQERMEKLEGTGKPFWSSAQQRYCTSDLKRNPINKYLRRYQHVVSAEGIRADESAARAKKPCWSVRDAITTRDRVALTWNPILAWSEEDVWAACGTSSAELERRRFLYRAGAEREAMDGWTGHPAYVLGNERLSCAMCVLASKNDILNGARHNPELYEELVRMENESGFGFRKDLWLRDLRDLLVEAKAGAA